MKTLMIITMVYTGWFSETMTINTEIVTPKVCERIAKSYTENFPPEASASAYVICMNLE